MDKYQPLNNNVVLKLREDSEHVSSGGVIIAADTSKKMLQKADVIAVSSQAASEQNIAEGDVVLVHEGRGQYINEDKTLLVFDASNIISKVLS